MSYRTKARAVVAAALLVSGLVVAVVPAGAQAEKPKAGEIGITADEIRIAVVADVENPINPGQFKTNVDAIQGYAKYVNKNGGIAGRKLVVDFIDSHLNAGESRNATIEACANDFAMVGTAAVFMSNVDDMVGCVDSTGAPTGLPDINTFTQELVHQCSSVSYSVSPPQLDCSTKDDPEPTYDVAFGQVRYYLSQDKDLHGICVGQNDLRSTTLTGTAHCEAAKQLGIKLDGDGLYGVSARAAQSALTPAVSAAREAGSTYVYALQSFGQVISLRREAKLQGLNTVEVWDCSRTCYSEQFLETGGADVEDQYAFLNALPLDETKSNKALAAYVKTVGAENVDAFGEVAWAAGMLFTETIEKIVKADGVNGITRARFLEELAKTKRFDADGLLAPTDIGARRPSPCYNLTQVQDGEYVRVHPKKAGTFDCNPKNIVSVQLAG